MTDTDPFFKYAWKFAEKLSHLPRQRCTWCIIAAALVLAVATVVSFVVLGHGSKTTGTKCYATGSFDGLTIYLQSNKTTMQSCASAATGAGLTNLSSLPQGLTEVCANDTVTVFMKPVQAATVRSLGLNPASICS